MKDKNVNETKIDNSQDMGVLRDYIAYAREHGHPKLTDEAQQKLIQCYVDMRKIGSGRGQISAYPRKYFHTFSCTILREEALYSNCEVYIKAV